MLFDVNMFLGTTDPTNLHVAEAMGIVKSGIDKKGSTKESTILTIEVGVSIWPAVSYAYCIHVITA